MFTGHTLRRSLAVAALLVALGIAVVQNVLIVGVRHYVLALWRRNVHVVTARVHERGVHFLVAAGRARV